MIVTVVDFICCRGNCDGGCGSEIGTRANCERIFSLRSLRDRSV